MKSHHFFIGSEGPKERIAGWRNRIDCDNHYKALKEPALSAAEGAKESPPQADKNCGSYSAMCNR